jgi:hypothetical protein
MPTKRVVKKPSTPATRTVRARPNVRHPQAGTKSLRAFKVGEGVPSIPDMVNELQDMTDVLLGRNDPPVNAGYLSMMEVADAFFARASEMTILLQQAEREGRVTRGSAHYKFRTGELRTFLEMAKRAADLGSRRLTAESLRWDMEMKGRESGG